MSDQETIVEHLESAHILALIASFTSSFDVKENAEWNMLILEIVYWMYKDIGPPVLSALDKVGFPRHFRITCSFIVG